MITLISIEGYGIIAVDLSGNMLWEWTYPVEAKGRIAGFDFDHGTGNIYVAGFTEVLEINKRGKILWRYSHPKIVDIHSLQLLPNGNVLVACAANDRALEINKKEGVVWSWFAKDHLPSPDGYVDHDDWRGVSLNNQWTHLNHAWEIESGDRLISLFNLRKVLRISKGGAILWSWGENTLERPHYVLPFRNNYLISDSGHNRVIEVSQSGEVVKEFKSGMMEPRGLEILPNGNILVTSTKNRKVLEIDENNKIIWSYNLPKRIQQVKNSNPYTSKRVEQWRYEEDSTIIERRLKALGYID